MYAKLFQGVYLFLFARRAVTLYVYSSINFCLIKAICLAELSLPAVSRFHITRVLCNTIFNAYQTSSFTLSRNRKFRTSSGGVRA